MVVMAQAPEPSVLPVQQESPVQMHPPQVAVVKPQQQQQPVGVQPPTDQQSSSPVMLVRAPLLATQVEAHPQAAQPPKQLARVSTFLDEVDPFAGKDLAQEMASKIGEPNPSGPQHDLAAISAQAPVQTQIQTSSAQQSQVNVDTLDTSVATAPPAPRRQRDPWLSKRGLATAKPDQARRQKSVSLLTQPNAAGMPMQYSAWTPSDSGAKAAAERKSAIAAMTAGFDDDDDASQAKPAPRPLPQRQHQQVSQVQYAKRVKPPPPPKEADVMYDDDDLPQHHTQSFAGLEGGWQALVKEQASKRAAKKENSDATIMQGLYGPDGGLPTVYKAWAPGQSFTQIAREIKRVSKSAREATPPVTQLILEAAQEHDEPAEASLLQEEATTMSVALITTATAMLQQFADVLQSKALHQLAKAHLTLPKIAALFRKLDGVDPMAHSKGFPKDKTGDALRWCQYFESKKMTVPPALHVAMLQADQAADELAKTATQHAAILEEVDARTQLHNTVRQDQESLRSLLQVVQHFSEASGTAAAQREMKARGGDAAAMSLAEIQAVDMVGDARSELDDVVGAAVRKRAEVQAAQKASIAKLRGEEKVVKGKWMQQKAVVAKTQAKVDAAKKSIKKIEASCDVAVAQFLQRQHQGHMEIVAIRAV